MQHHIMQRAPQIARQFVGMWRTHLAALDQASLPYLDHLIEAALEEESMSIWALQSQLVKMVPTMKPSTAGRLLELKFAGVDHSMLKPRIAG